MNKTKILHPVLCYYPSQAGGPANTLYWLNSALTSTTLKSLVISTKFGLKEDINKKTFSRHHYVNFHNSANKEFLKEAKKELNNVDIIQFSSLFFPPTLTLLITAILKKKRIILSPRGELYPAALSQKKVKKLIWISLIKLFQRKINFIATNPFEKELISKKFKKAKSIEIIANFIEIPQKLNLDVENKFVFLGRINPIKNIHTIIKAIALFPNNYNDLKLVIVGDARLPYELEYKQTLITLVKKLNLENRVTFRGHLDNISKNNVLSSSKALILPSKSENFGNVVIEALAQGTPVIASKGTPWKILEEKKAGFWIESDANELANTMLNILNMEKAEYQDLRNNAYSLCISNYDIQKNKDIWLDYYNKIKNNV